jgi:hypothetical protein
MPRRPPLIDLCGVKTVRTTIALLAVAAILGVGAVVAFAAPAAVGHAASLNGGAGQSAYCRPGEKNRRARALAAYRKSMAAARQRYFRSHPKSADRVRFVKAQNAQLKALQRRLAQCS